MGLKRVRKRLTSRQVEDGNGTALPEEEETLQAPVTRRQEKPSPEATSKALTGGSKAITGGHRTRSLREVLGALTARQADQNSARRHHTAPLSLRFLQRVETVCTAAVGVNWNINHHLDLTSMVGHVLTFGEPARTRVSPNDIGKDEAVLGAAVAGRALAAATGEIRLVQHTVGRPPNVIAKAALLVDQDGIFQEQVAAAADEEFEGVGLLVGLSTMSMIMKSSPLVRRLRHSDTSTPMMPQRSTNSGWPAPLRDTRSYYYILRGLFPRLQEDNSQSHFTDGSRCIAAFVAGRKDVYILNQRLFG
ncbi:hypothetical protein CONLIGDRAFT_649912 [Coniochaeta ligniaria NRRL 30616]|uniref:Uncharacterized protein n=1 Tax=Coniochaeta ligniaria NRRL 30616 TaxID=1408157 RepID=A0A1J7I6D7_9PEZI|nr:hypothetical protein CONLIGDRAFT_649912 [Coniochaeta ligniaria NRRL 30616]